MKLRQNRLSPVTLEDLPGVHVGESLGDSIHEDFGARVDQLESLRQKWLANIHRDSRPLLCLHLPETLLREYSERRTASRLGDVFALANHFQSRTDRVVFVGSIHTHRIVRAFQQACCDPHWNELTRGERGSKPRVYFSGDSLDNDSFQGLLQLFSRNRATNRHESFGWGAIALKSGDSDLEPDLGFDFAKRHLRLESEATTESDLHYECLPCISEAVGGNFKLPAALLPLSQIGLLPAAILGINIMELLAGAAAVTKLFMSTPGMQNPILRWVAWHQIAPFRRVAIWNHSMDSSCDWLQDLYSSLGLASQGARYQWHFRHPLSQPVSEDQLRCCSHFRVEQARFDPLPMAPMGTGDVVWDPSSDRPRAIPPINLDGPTSTELATATYQRTVEQQSKLDGSGMTLRLSDLGELSLGQWMQWMIIASLLELDLA